jgi:hypothetical protein
MEAILLTCLLFPTDWKRQSFLVRKWGEFSVSHGKAELAVRCFSCMGLETTEPWFSPRAQDAVFSAQKQALLGSQLSPPLSPPSVGSSRVAAKMASLKLVTDFTHGPQPQRIRQEDEERTPMNAGVTPIAESALSPSGAAQPWRTARDPSREPSSARVLPLWQFPIAANEVNPTPELPLIMLVEKQRHCPSPPAVPLARVILTNLCSLQQPMLLSSPATIFPPQPLVCSKT